MPHPLGPFQLVGRRFSDWTLNPKEQHIHQSQPGGKESREHWLCVCVCVRTCVCVAQVVFFRLATVTALPYTSSSRLLVDNTDAFNPYFLYKAVWLEGLASLLSQEFGNTNAQICLSHSTEPHANRVPIKEF